MELTEAERERADKLNERISDADSWWNAVDIIALALRQARAEGMERAARICHALNLTLEYTGQPLQDCISNRIRAEAAKLTGKE